MKEDIKIGYAPAALQPAMALARNPERDVQARVVNFTTTQTGFKVQEIVTQKKMAPDITANFQEMAQDGYGVDNYGYIVPDEGSSYIYKAQATLNVDCSTCAKDTLTVNAESNTIVYGSQKVKNDLAEYSKSLEARSNIIYN